MSETPTTNEPFLVTLKLDLATADALTVLRRAYFPPERNFIDAHITLFHALPGEEREAVYRTLEPVCAETASFPISFSGVRFTGRGVALAVESEALRRLRARLAGAWDEWLTPQDRQGYRPHVTIQNKVTPEQARAALERLSREGTPTNAEALGLSLWVYRGGPWEFLSDHPFSERKSDERSE